jgi:post-segregation antitoxin (ccd killing protein)
MITTERIDISIPIGLREQAKKRGINISWHCARAIQKEIDRIDKSEE